MPIRASERIYRDREGGGRELAYAVGAEISDDDAVALGLVEKPPADKAKRGPKEQAKETPKQAAKPKASRDRAMGPKK